MPDSTYTCTGIAEFAGFCCLQDQQSCDKDGLV